MSKKEMQKKHFKINMQKEKPMGILGIALFILGLLGIVFVAIIIVITSSVWQGEKADDSASHTASYSASGYSAYYNVETQAL